MVAFNFPPSANVGVFRTLRFTRFLPESNWSTAVLTSLPVNQGSLDPALEMMIPEETEVRRVSLVRPEDEFKKRISRILRVQPEEKEQNKSANNGSEASEAKSGFTLRKKIMELLFAMPDNRIGWRKAAVSAGLEMVKQLQPSVIYATGPPFTTMLVGIDIAKKSQLPLVLDFRDPWTRVPWGPRNKSWLANRMAVHAEKRCVRFASRVVLNTLDLERNFVDHYSAFDRKSFLTIPNGFDPEMKRQVEELISADHAHHHTQKSETRFHILHPGSLYRNRDPCRFVDAMAQLKKQGKSVLFEQLGPCEAEFNLASYASDRDLADDVRISPPVSHQQMLERMSQVGAFLLLQPGTGLQVPGKLFEMILFRKPILAVCENGAISDLINKYKIGLTVPADDIEAIADGINSISTMQWSPDGWESVLADYDGRNHSRQLANLFDEIIHNR